MRRSGMRRSAGATTALLVVLALAACTEVPAASEPAPVGAQETATPEPGSQPTSVDLPGSDEMPLVRWTTPLEDSPFTEWLAYGATLNEWATRNREAQADWSVETQELIAACMAAEGFDYVPTEPDLGPGPDPGLATVDWVTIPRLPETREDAERYGYGVDDIEAFEAMLAEQGGLDANTAYAEALGEPGRMAYYLALVGFDGEEQSAVGGCSGQARMQIPAPGADDPSARYFEQYDPLLIEMARFPQEVVARDPRTVALDAEWAACMVDQNYDLIPPFDLPGPTPLSAADVAVRTRPDGEVGDPQPDTPTSEIPYDERYLTGDPAERVIALADFDCRVATDYLARLTAIQVDLEKEFVASRAEHLQEMAAALSLTAP